MSRHARRSLAAAAAVPLAFGLAGPACAAVSSCVTTGAGAPVQCVAMPAASQPEVGQEIQAGSGTDPGTPWMITDKNGAPMAWVNLYGMYSGGDGGKDPGGLICVTDGVLRTVACLTPRGTLTLSSDGGKTHVTLTAGDIRFLRKLERGGAR